MTFPQAFPRTTTCKSQAWNGYAETKLSNRANNARNPTKYVKYVSADWQANRPTTQRSNTFFCYSVDVEIKKEFISCCGPGEWMVCNCLSERDDYLTSAQAGTTLASKETEESKDPSDSASKSEDPAVPPPF